MLISNTIPKSFSMVMETMIRQLMLLLAVMCITMSVFAVGCQSNQGTTLVRVQKMGMAGYARGGDATVIVSDTTHKNPAKSGPSAYEVTTQIKVIERTGKESTYQLPGRTDYRWWSSPDTLVTNPERTSLLYRRVDQDGNTVCSIDLLSGKINEIYSSKDKLKNALYSPDGKSLALLSGVEVYTIAIVDLKNPEKQVIWQNDGSIPGLLKLIGWSESGHEVMFSSEYTPSGGKKDCRIFALSDNGKEPKELYRFADPGDLYGLPIVSKDDFIYCNQSGSLIRISRKDGQEQTIFTAPDGYQLFNPSLSPSGRYLSASISRDPDTKETGFYVIGTASGKSAYVKAIAKSKQGPAIGLLEWHPKKDLLLAVCADEDGTELREYNAQELLGVK